MLDSVDQMRDSVILKKITGKLNIVFSDSVILSFTIESFFIGFRRANLSQAATYRSKTDLAWEPYSDVSWEVFFIFCTTMRLPR